MKILRTACLLLPVLLLLAGSGCKFYKRDYAFRLDKEHPENITYQTGAAEDNYKIKNGDWIVLKVYTNKGELILDPNSELSKTLQAGVGGSPPGTGVSGGISANLGRYLVGNDGFAIIPLIGKVKFAGYTCRQSDSLVAQKLTPYYQEPYAIVRVANRRIFVFGGGGSGSGGHAAPVTGQIVDLPNENISIVEVLAQVGGIPAYADAKHIELIRGPLDNPQVYLIDVSTIQGMKTSLLTVEPNDVIYIVPGRRNSVEVLRDYGQFFGIITALAYVSLLISTRL
ncbi:MAG: polysaccharide biosynthesis/export family protein [Bacteroidota bacterium]